MGKISLLIISLLLVSLVTGVAAIWITEIGSTYSQNTSEFNISVYNKMDTLHNNVETTQEKVENITSKDNSIFDIIGNFFSAGFGAVKTSAQSIEVANELADTAVKQVPMGEGGALFSKFLLSIVAVAFFIGILLAILIGDKTNKV